MNYLLQRELTIILNIIEFTSLQMKILASKEKRFKYQIPLLYIRKVSFIHIQDKRKISQKKRKCSTKIELVARQM